MQAQVQTQTQTPKKMRMQMAARIKLAYTGIETDDRVGSAAERNYYRVIPAGSTVKLFFKNVEEYGMWREREYCCPLNDDDQLIIDDPFDFYPLPLMPISK